MAIKKRKVIKTSKEDLGSGPGTNMKRSTAAELRARKKDKGTSRGSGNIRRSTKGL